MNSNALDSNQVWRLLADIPGPELPTISITDPGIVRDVAVRNNAVTVAVTPTYSGYPATATISDSNHDKLHAAGIDEVHVDTRLSPPWTTDWLQPDAAEKLRAHGVTPPGHRAINDAMHLLPPCPRCGEKYTILVSRFGATACKTMYPCPVCLEPLEYFKPF